jgi:hypothetical protein
MAGKSNQGNELGRNELGRYDCLSRYGWGPEMNSPVAKTK